MTPAPSPDAISIIELPSAEPIDPPARRKPWAAALLSLILPGLGQLYAGAPRRALGMWVAVTAASLAGLRAALLLPGLAQLVAIIVVGLGTRALVMWDAARTARVPALAHRRAPYARWYVYVALFLVSAFVWQPVYRGWLHAHVASAYRIPTMSMAPALLRGDYLLTVPLRGEIARGDMVVHRTVNGLFIKRVVAIPGDTVAMRDGRLTMDGRPVAEPYASWADTADAATPEFDWQRTLLASEADTASYHPTLRTWGPLVMPPGQYFLLGDSRGNSLDSRYLGAEPGEGIIGRPTVVYFSADSGAVRWRRIGHTVE